MKNKKNVQSNNGVKKHLLVEVFKLNASRRKLMRRYHLSRNIEHCSKTVNHKKISEEEYENKFLANTFN